MGFRVWCSLSRPPKQEAQHTRRRRRRRWFLHAEDICLRCCCCTTPYNNGPHNVFTVEDWVVLLCDTKLCRWNLNGWKHLHIIQPLETRKSPKNFGWKQHHINQSTAGSRKSTKLWMKTSSHQSTPWKARKWPTFGGWWWWEERVFVYNQLLHFVSLFSCRLEATMLFLWFLVSFTSAHWLGFSCA